MIPVRNDRRGGSQKTRLTRRGLIQGAGLGVVGAQMSRNLSLPRVAAHEAFGTDVVDHLPLGRGQTELQVYVEATGHTVGGLFLDYWRANGASLVYGNPISEPFLSADGYASQAFENGVFQYRPEFLYSEDPIIRLMPIGQRIASYTRDTGEAWTLGRLLGDESTPAALRDRPFVEEEDADDVVDELRPWYEFHEGAFYLGKPRSRAVRDRGAVAQWFESGLLLADGEDGTTRLAPLVREQAASLEIDTTPVARGDLPLFDEWLFLGANNPDPHGDPAAPGRKRIEVSLSEQMIRAYQGETLVTAPFVSTGIDPNGTDLGTFHVRLKYPKQDMQGFTNATGEVLGFGEAPEGTLPYSVQDVPSVMYFNLEAEAFHGTYWHNNFGQKMSHGCVNLPLDVAAFLYDWAPLGTRVVVHE